MFLLILRHLNYGNFNFAFTIIETKNGVTTKKISQAGIIKVSKGTQSKTVIINNYIDNSGNIIDFKIRLGKFSFSETYDKQGCSLKSNIEGTFDSSLMTMKQTLIVTCGKDVLTSTLEGKGVK